MFEDVDISKSTLAHVAEMIKERRDISKLAAPTETSETLAEEIRDQNVRVLFAPKDERSSGDGSERTILFDSNCSDMDGTSTPTIAALLKENELEYMIERGGFL